MREFSVFASHKERIDTFLAKTLGISRSFIKQQIKSGKIRRNGTVVGKASSMLAAGDKVSGSLEENHTTNLVPIKYPLHIIYEDDDLLVINKPQGVVVHHAAGHRGETLVNYLLYHLLTSTTFRETSPTRPGIVHRLDKGTSGLLLVAKTRYSLEQLSRQFKSRSIRKEYEAIVYGVMKPQGTINSVIGRDKKDRKKMSSRTCKGRSAVTAWETTQTFRHFTHVRLFPQTGRTHQLRVHLSEMGFPIVGDALYRKKSHPVCCDELGKIIGEVTYPFLHAKRLTLTHPVSAKQVDFTAERPVNFDKFLSLLRVFDRC